MTPLSIAFVATAAICALVALQHMVVAFRVPEQRMHLLFAVAACGVAGDAFVSRATYGATHPQEFLGLMPFGALFIVTTIVALSLFIALRTRAVRMWMVVSVAFLGFATVAIDFTTGIAYVGPVELNHGQHMLPRVLLHMVEAASPIEHLMDRPDRQLTAQEVADNTIGLLDTNDLCPVHGSVIRGLPSAFG